MPALVAGIDGSLSFHSTRVANIPLASFELGTDQLGWAFVKMPWDLREGGQWWCPALLQNLTSWPGTGAHRLQTSCDQLKLDRKCRRRSNSLYKHFLENCNL